MVIEITEGCVCYSYTIDGKEFCRLADKESEIYDPKIIVIVINKLLEEYQDKYTESLIDSVYFAVFKDDLYDAINDKVAQIIGEEKYLDLFDLFVELVKANPNTKSDYSGPCDCCGDYIDSWILEL